MESHSLSYLLAGAISTMKEVSEMMKDVSSRLSNETSYNHLTVSNVHILNNCHLLLQDVNCTLQQVPNSHNSSIILPYSIVLYNDCRNVQSMGSVQSEGEVIEIVLKCRIESCKLLTKAGSHGYLPTLLESARCWSRTASAWEKFDPKSVFHLECLQQCINVHSLYGGIEAARSSLMGVELESHLQVVFDSVMSFVKIEADEFILDLSKVDNLQRAILLLESELPSISEVLTHEQLGLSRFQSNLGRWLLEQKCYVEGERMLISAQKTARMAFQNLSDTEETAKAPHYAYFHQLQQALCLSCIEQAFMKKEFTQVPNSVPSQDDDHNTSINSLITRAKTYLQDSLESTRVTGESKTLLQSYLQLKIAILEDSLGEAEMEMSYILNLEPYPSLNTTASASLAPFGDATFSIIADAAKSYAKMRNFDVPAMKVYGQLTSRRYSTSPEAPFLRYDLLEALLLVLSDSHIPSSVVEKASTTSAPPNPVLSNPHTLLADPRALSLLSRLLADHFAANNYPRADPNESCSDSTKEGIDVYGHVLERSRSPCLLPQSLYLALGDLLAAAAQCAAESGELRLCARASALLRMLGESRTCVDGEAPERTPRFRAACELLAGSALLGLGLTAEARACARAAANVVPSTAAYFLLLKAIMAENVNEEPSRGERSTSTGGPLQQYTSVTADEELSQACAGLLTAPDARPAHALALAKLLTRHTDSNEPGVHSTHSTGLETGQDQHKIPPQYALLALQALLELLNCSSDSTSLHPQLRLAALSNYALALVPLAASHGPTKNDGTAFSLGLLCQLCERISVDLSGNTAAHPQLVRLLLEPPSDAFFSTAAATESAQRLQNKTGGPQELQMSLEVCWNTLAACRAAGNLRAAAAAALCLRVLAEALVQVSAAGTRKASQDINESIAGFTSNTNNASMNSSGQIVGYDQLAASTNSTEDKDSMALYGCYLAICAEFQLASSLLRCVDVEFIDTKFSTPTADFTGISRSTGAQNDVGISANPPARSATSSGHLDVASLHTLLPEVHVSLQTHILHLDRVGLLQAAVAAAQRCSALISALPLRFGRESIGLFSETEVSTPHSISMPSTAPEALEEVSVAVLDRGQGACVSLSLLGPAREMLEGLLKDFALPLPIHDRTASIALKRPLPVGPLVAVSTLLEFHAVARGADTDLLDSVLFSSFRFSERENAENAESKGLSRTEKALQLLLARLLPGKKKESSIEDVNWISPSVFNINQVSGRMYEHLAEVARQRPCSSRAIALQAAQAALELQFRQGPTLPAGKLGQLSLMVSQLLPSRAEALPLIQRVVVAVQEYLDGAEGASVSAPAPVTADALEALLVASWNHGCFYHRLRARARALPFLRLTVDAIPLLGRAIAHETASARSDASAELVSTPKRSYLFPKSNNASQLIRRSKELQDAYRALLSGVMGVGSVDFEALDVGNMAEGTWEKKGKEGGFSSSSFQTSDELRSSAAKRQLGEGPEDQPVVVRRRMAEQDDFLSCDADTLLSQ